MNSKSGKFVLRIDKSLHQELAQQARQKGISLNQEVLSHLGSEIKDSPFIKSILSAYSPLAIIQFGSSVTGKSTKTSDLDLLIVLAKTQAISKECYDVWDRLELPLYISPHFVHSPSDLLRLSALWLEVGLYGRVLYSSSDQIHKLLYDIKTMISSGKYQRKISHGQPYWLNQSQGEISDQ